jgi:type I site-specific restriction endonuclease
MGVPMHMMMSEVGFKLGNKQLKADILVYGRDAGPLVVVECKRPDVVVDATVLEQAIRYNMVLAVDYIIVTNGNTTYIFGKTEEGFKQVSQLPNYDQMTKL